MKNKYNRFLFPNFLEDKNTYTLNQQFWKNHIFKILRKDTIKEQHWVNEDYDGNPIFSVLIPNNKAIRIIQEAPKMDTFEISAWIKKTEDIKSVVVHELVISLELSTTTKDIALKLMEYWIKKEIGIKNMEQFIDEQLK